MTHHDHENDPHGEDAPTSDTDDQHEPASPGAPGHDSSEAGDDPYDIESDIGPDGPLPTDDE